MCSARPNRLVNRKRFTRGATSERRNEFISLMTSARDACRYAKSRCARAVRACSRVPSLRQSARAQPGPASVTVKRLRRTNFSARYPAESGRALIGSLPQSPPQIVGEPDNRCVTLFRLLLQRLRDNRVEVAAQLLAELWRRGTALSPHSRCALSASEAPSSPHRRPTCLAARSP